VTNYKYDVAVKGGMNISIELTSSPTDVLSLQIRFPNGKTATISRFVVRPAIPSKGGALNAPGLVVSPPMPDGTYSNGGQRNKLTVTEPTSGLSLTFSDPGDPYMP
jgi:hypothetical protein